MKMALETAPLQMQCSRDFQRREISLHGHSVEMLGRIPRQNGRRSRIGIPFLEDLRKDRDFGRRNPLLTLLPNLIVELKTQFSHTNTTDRGSSAELVDLRSYQRDERPRFQAVLS